MNLIKLLFLPLSFKKVALTLLIFVIIFFIFNDSQNKVLEKKLESNEILILKFKDFQKDRINMKTEFNVELIESILDTAKTYLGTPNEIGGVDYNSIDASGLIHVSLNKNGILEFPRIAQDMARYGERILEVKDLKRGDLIFFFDTYETDNLITSAGIYLGENNFISSTSKKGVTINKMDNPTFKENYWMEHFFYGTRIFK